MASQFPPKKNTAFTLYFTLYKNDGTVIANPGTITKKVSIDGAAVADIAAAVTEEDTTYGQCSVVLAAGEMNGDAIWVYIKDDTTGCVPFTCTLYTAAQTLDELDAVADAIKAKTDNLPADPADQSAVEAAITAAHATTDGKINAVDDYVDTEIAAIKAVTDKLDTALELDEAVYRFTANALELAPVDGAAPTAAAIRAEIDANSTQLAAIKTKTDGLNFTGTDVKATLDGETVTVGTNNDKTGYALTVAYDAAKTAASQASVNTIDGIVDAILEDTGTTLPGTLTTMSGYIDTEVAAIKAKTDNLPSDPADQSAVEAAITAAHSTTNGKIDAILADTNELQTDWKNGGRLDLLIDGILEDTGTTLPATLTTIEGKVDTVDGIVDSILADTNELQTDWHDGGRLDLLLDNCQVAGTGAITWPYTVTDGDGNPVEGCYVWVTSDVAGTNILASGTTNSSGVVTFCLDSGTVYVWRKKSGYNATNPDTETVS